LAQKLLVANQKAKYLVKKLNKIAKDESSPAPFEFHNQGSLAYIGNWCVTIIITFLEDLCQFFCRKAIYDKPGQPGQEDGFLQKETGRLAWLLWRSAYFTMTLSVRNRYVVLDAALNYVFDQFSEES
jgi:NADH dehydrogenase FAD-containing subunit